MEMARLLVDFGLVMLIWLVQIVIYPSFGYYTADRLKQWHDRYVIRITWFVAPLMFAQIGILAYQLLNSYDWSIMISAALVAAVWALTFFKAVPLHNEISQGKNLTSNCQKLVLYNWPRTVLWTLVFLLAW